MAIHDPIIVARFWSKVDVRRSMSDCWPWTASTANGYGHMKHKGQMFRSNRICWEIVNEELLGDRQALHTCDNKLCCNPSHIYAGTAAQNSADVHVRSRRDTNKLSIREVTEIRRRLNLGEPVAEVADAFGIERGHAHRIKRRKSWRYAEANFGRA